MSRSLKKGPFIDPKLEAKVVAQAEGNKLSLIHISEPTRPY